MSNIILQHWSGHIDSLTQMSIDNIKEYSEFCGADYRLMTGDCFHPRLSSPCQKVVMLSEQFDEYDNVVMMDADMFTRTNLNKNIFNESGMGRHWGIQDKLVENLQRRFPLLGDPKYPYWGGSIYKFDRETRKLLRSHLEVHEFSQFDGNYEDEGILHRLAVRAKMPINENTYLERDRWNKSSFEPDVEDSYIVHIRPKRVQGGPKYPKIENYMLLSAKGII